MFFRSFLRRDCSFIKILRSNFSTEIRSYVPRRALMYVPASDERKLLKIPTMEADCVVMDCEDGVAVNRKDEARKNVAKFLSNEKNNPSKFKFELGVRVNSISSGFLEEDMKILSQARCAPSAIMLPKVDSSEELEKFYEIFKKFRSGERASHLKNCANLVIWIESARALIDMDKILQTAKKLGNGSTLKVDGVVFGSDDFCADIGATRSKEASELLYARQKFLVVCKAFRLQAIDLVFIDYKDLDGLRLQSEEAQKMGFTGKQVIHPSQISVVQKAFLPTDQKVKWARELLEEFHKHEQSGKGAFTFKEQMIDAPTVLQAKNIVALVEKTCKK